MQFTAVFKTKLILLHSLIAMIVYTQPAFGDDWQVQLSLGQIDQDYKEVDSSGLTKDGILNTETGTVPFIELEVINTTNPVIISEQEWVPYGRFNYKNGSGDTDYDGYLQSGTTLTPYQTSTENQFNQIEFDLGMSHQTTPNLILTPLLSINHSSWERELKQYTEQFHHTAMLAGANLNWQPRQQVPFRLIFEAKTGRILDSNIDVPKLGLNQDIGHSKISQFGMIGQYNLSDHLSINAGVSKQSWDYEQSDIQNGYQYPDSESEQTLWQLGLGYGF